MADSQFQIIRGTTHSISQGSPIEKLPKFPSFPVGPQPSGATTYPYPNVLSGLPNSTPQTQTNVEFKVRLVSVLDMVQGAPGEIKQVIFKVTPVLTESRTVEYTAIQPIHMPGGIQVYKNTGSRTFDLAAHFISRNAADALENIRYLQVLRSWTMPFFGKSATDFAASNNKKISKVPVLNFVGPPTSDEQNALAMSKIQGSKPDKTSGVNLLGAPPEVLYLYGYSTKANDARNGVNGINLNRIPVVITSLSMSYPEDVDYIPVQISPTASTEPFPIKMDVSITLVETHSPTEYEEFSLESYKKGILKNF